MAKDLTGQQVGTQRRSHANEPKTKVLTGMTKFPMSYKMANTARYGHITPFYYQHSRGDDIVPLFSEHDLRTYTLQSPMMSDLNMNKTYFMVDMQAIYPDNYQKIFIAPSKGSDVPEDARLINYNLLEVCNTLLSYLRLVDDDTFYDLSSVTQLNYATFYCRFILFLESIFSAGSLFSEFNIHLQDFLYALYNNKEGDYVRHSFDEWFDTQFASLLYYVESFKVGNDYLYITSAPNSYYDEDTERYYVTIRRALEIMRDNDFTVNSLLNDSFGLFFENVVQLNFVESFRGSDIDLSDYPLNLEVLAGYQLGCIQFFTDSHVDFIFDVDKYRDSLISDVYNLLENSDDYTLRDLYFDYNSIRCPYDVLSGHIIDIMLYELPHYISPALSRLDDMAWRYSFNFFIKLFGHRNSLRYGDYFVTGRPNPLGIGDVSVDTSQASISVVDITRNIQYQRFWNAVNLSRQSIGEYARNVLGLDNADEISYDIPAFIAHKSLPIRGMEIENTAERQTEPNSITTILRSENNIHAFELKTKRPCIIYGVYSFDVARIYSKTIDRMHMHLDRYDDFIPQLQYTGDQEIYRRELNSVNNPYDNFAYAVRYMEYKIRTHYASGGAITSLPSWFMITDGIEGDELYSPGNITPDFIRSKPTEFDRFYASLSGYSLGTYFHFIVMSTNHQTLTRKMDYAPEPLK